MSEHLLHVILDHGIKIRFECLDPAHLECATYNLVDSELTPNHAECWVETHALEAIENGIGAIGLLEDLDYGYVTGPICVDVRNAGHPDECIPRVAIWRY